MDQGGTPGEGEEIVRGDGEERMAHDPGSAPGGAPQPIGPNNGREAVRNVEVLSDLSLKRMFRVMYIGVLAGTGLLAVLFGLKMTFEFDRLGQVRPIVILNAAVAASGLAVLTTCLACFLRRLLVVWRAGLTWSMRRWRMLVLFMLQLACVYVSNLAFLAPNVYVLSAKCGHMDEAVNVFGAVRWTALHSLLALFLIQARSYSLMVDRLGHPLGPWEDATYLDAPLRAHWFIGVYWVIVEAVTTLTALTSEDTPQELCMDNSKCPAHDVVKDMFAWYALSSVGYFGMFLHFMRRAFVALAKKSYVRHRWHNIAARFAFRQLGVVMLFGVLSFGFLWSSRTSSCISYATSWLGFAPIQMTLTLFMAVRVWLTMPILPGCDKPARKPAAEAHWLEKQSLQHRRDSGGDVSGKYGPLFCFETAIKLVYWCEFIYEYDHRTKVAKPPFKIETALSLYDLTHFEYLHAPEKDAHAIVAWSQAGTIVMCFRGTYSTANIMTDLKFWRLPHPPKRGHRWLGTCPLVHRGFLQSWLNEGFNQTVLGKIKEILDGPGFNLDKLRIYVTGHSLGGAMAVLASHDISRQCGILPHHLSCYTFGSPRVGNHSFAADYEKAVPDTWHVINNLDVVPRMGKFWVLFKRAGQRVIINSRGDMIVSPMFLEFKLSSVFIGNKKVVHHMLTAYRKSLSAVVLAQFHRYKALPGGYDAMQEMLEKGDITQVLGVSRMSANKLLALSSKVWKRHAQHLGVMAKEGQQCASVASGSGSQSLSTGKNSTFPGALKMVISGLMPWMSRQGEDQSPESSNAGFEEDIEAAVLQALEE